MLARGAGRWVAVSSFFPVSVGAIAYSLAVGAVTSAVATGVAFLVPISVVFFFRDPNREPDGSGIVSPADGKVTVLREEEDGSVCLGVFMNVHNVHVNRFPVAGKVVSVERHEGGYAPAFSKESERNERVVTTVEADEGEGVFEVVQIAGAFARRITTYLDQGKKAERGERLGLIAFGSRADIVFPPEYSTEDIEVSEGQKVKAGETVVVSCCPDER